MSERPRPHTVAASSLTMTELVLPEDTNTWGNMFGGRVMALVDKCAAMSAIRHSRGGVLTASFDRVDFLHPIRLGEMIILEGRVHATFRSSLEVGVDDYLPKPFEPRELLLRIRNILKRGQGPSGPHEEIRMGEYVFHVTRGELKCDEDTIRLTERERDLLRLFAHRLGTPIQRHELSGEDSTGNDRAIDVQINRLRRKIETDPSNPVYLQTVRGKGYILYSD